MAYGRPAYDQDNHQHQVIVIKIYHGGCTMDIHNFDQDTAHDQYQKQWQPIDIKATPNSSTDIKAGAVKSLTLTILHHLARLFDNLTIWLGCTAGDNAIQLTGTIQDEHCRGGTIFEY